MKGFGARERNGLIVFLCLVIVLLALGPIADRMGCTSRHDPPVPTTAAHVDSVGCDTVMEVEALNTSSQRVGSKARRKHRERRDTVRKSGRRKSTGTPRRSRPSDPGRRNYLDEPI